MNSNQFLFDIENAIEALAKLQNYYMGTDWVTLSDEDGKITISLGDSVDELLSNLYKKELKVRRALKKEEAEHMERWNALAVASHQHAEQDA